MHAKVFFVEKLIEISGVSSPRILEMSCGTARYIPKVIERNPHLTYVGIEPFKPSFDQAIKNTKELPAVTIHNQLGYTEIPEQDLASFDIVFSISALEHIKDLDAYIARAASYVKKGGLMVHRYDLGHALYPTSLKERIHAFLGNHFPKLLPESKFVRYVSIEEVKQLYQKHGCAVVDMSYHQMPNHKSLEKATRGEVKFSEMLQELCVWEWKSKDIIHQLPLRERERLFPAIAVWGKK